MIRRTKKYVVRWRHRTLDTPDHPYHGGGFAYGSTKRKALASFFGPPFAQSSDPIVHEHNWRRADAYGAGDIEIVDMEVCTCGSSEPDYFGQRDQLEDPDCPRHGSAPASSENHRPLESE